MSSHSNARPSTAASCWNQGLDFQSQNNQNHNLQESSSTNNYAQQLPHTTNTPRNLDGTPPAPAAPVLGTSRQNHEDDEEWQCQALLELLVANWSQGTQKEESPNDECAKSPNQQEEQVAAKDPASSYHPPLPLLPPRPDTSASLSLSLPLPATILPLPSSSCFSGEAVSSSSGNASSCGVDDDATHNNNEKKDDLLHSILPPPTTTSSETCTSMCWPPATISSIFVPQVPVSSASGPTAETVSSQSDNTTGLVAVGANNAETHNKHHHSEPMDHSEPINHSAPITDPSAPITMESSCQSVSSRSRNSSRSSSSNSSGKLRPYLPRNAKMPKQNAKPQSPVSEPLLAPIMCPTQTAFFEQTILLMNSYICRETRQNRGFGPLLRAGLATPGFARVPKVVQEMVTTGGEAPAATYQDIRNALQASHYGHPTYNVSAASRQVALWFTEARVGTFVMLRHEYAKCPYLPKRLKVTNNSSGYMGKVYVIGVITRLVPLGSLEEKDIVQRELHDLQCRIPTSLQTFARVHWFKMGYKANLKPSTQKYLTAVCQSTMTRICQPGKQWCSDKTQCSTDWRSVREDLWNTATISIRSAEFAE
ncbi:hypothetical protein ACA910_013765 [Epithemia clementina (nom. ined.)]